jgi:hypothetical protein
MIIIIFSYGLIYLIIIIFFFFKSNDNFEIIWFISNGYVAQMHNVRLVIIMITLKLWL